METIEAIAENIEDHVNITSQLEMVCQCYNINFEASPLYNFRDALSHYVLCYEATTDEERIAQGASIKEHIFRGTKDIFVFILYEMKERTSDAFNTARSREEEQAFRRLLHEYKKLEIEIRRNTESTIIRSLTPFVEKLNDLIENTKRLFEYYGLDFLVSKNNPFIGI